MKLDIPTLKAAITKKGYKWFDDQINLIAVRTGLNVPDIFNDFMCTVWKQRPMPAGLNDTQKQEWLKSNLFLGKDGKTLKVDGDFGPSSQHALSQYEATVGKERIIIGTVTTEPGSTYQKKLLNKDGCWVMMPAQMINAYKLGLHQGKSDHKCLRSLGKIFGMRDNDLDGIAGNDKDAVAKWTDGTTVGANIHGAQKAGITSKIGPWSAGCQVYNNWASKEDMITIAESYKDVNNGWITYTLIEEKDLA